MSLTGTPVVGSMNSRICDRECRAVVYGLTRRCLVLMTHLVVVENEEQAIQKKAP